MRMVGIESLSLRGRRARPDGRDVPRLEADLRSGRSRTEPEIALLRGHEHRVGDAAAPVLARRLPLVKAHRAEEDRLAGGIPVEVAVEGANVAPRVLTAVVPDGFPLGVVEEVPPTGQLEPADAAPLDLAAAIEGE